MARRWRLNRIARSWDLASLTAAEGPVKQPGGKLDTCPSYPLAGNFIHQASNISSRNVANVKGRDDDGFESNIVLNLHA